MNGAPGTSVVVASFSSEESTLRRCLTSLEPQAGGVQVIVATACGAAATARLAARFAAFEFVEAAAGTSVFRLRSLGVARARGEIVLLTEDHCEFAEGWRAAHEAAHRAGHAVVGGPVENGAVARAYLWGLYLAEYAALMPPLPEGSASILAVNASYSREALRSCRPVWEDLFYEGEVHEALQKAGHRFFNTAAALVTSHFAVPLGPAMSHLFRGGHRYGLHRQAAGERLRGALLLLATPAIPLLLLLRVFRVVVARRPDRIPVLLCALPCLIPLVIAWSAGEASGYCARRMR